MRSLRADDEGSQDCRDARYELDDAAANLQISASYLHTCASYQGDDCYSEYWDVESNFNRYQSAFRDVEDYCE